MRFVSLMLVCFALLLGCNSDKPDDLLAEDTYINLMVELQLLRSYQQQGQPDSTAIDSLQNAIFKQYEVTESQFRVSHEYYQKDLNQQSERISEAIERLRRDRITGTDSSAGNESSETDSL